ncbi:MAG: ABC transporter ATP-binding protein [Chloroflexota bacterium]
MADLIATQGLTKRFGGLTAVNHVNFAVQEGQVAGVIGPNGSGKTTLFNLLSGFFSPTEGTITFHDQEITKLPPHRRVGLGISRTFQLVSVFASLAVWENLVLSTLRFKDHEATGAKFYFRRSREKAITADCLDALTLVGLGEKASLPTSQLSYGDKRKLEIAIALSLKPTLLLLDEPLAGLSDHEIGEVITLIHRVRKGFTMVIIEHKISKIVDLVERLSVMNEGRVIAEGLPDQVLKDPAVRECYWGKEESRC